MRFNVMDIDRATLFMELFNALKAPRKESAHMTRVEAGRALKVFSSLNNGNVTEYGGVVFNYNCQSDNIDMGDVILRYDGAGKVEEIVRKVMGRLGATEQ
jgi:hypothetical protein